MHAYLLIGNSTEYLVQSIEDLSNKLHTKIMKFSLAKIEDVRNLNNLLRLSFSEPTLIVLENVEDATEEALNAFLKNLEEPQENIYFALTASSIRKVLPTIVSRCQIIKVQSTKWGTGSASKVQSADVEEFLTMSTSQKLAFFDKIRARDEAIDFIESLIFFLHGKKDLKNMELLIKTLTRLRANGSVNLHLTNLITNISDLKTNNHN